MIGDWVKLPQMLADYSPARVEEINDKGCIADGWPLLNDEIRPVLLTREILKKNGMEVHDWIVEVDGGNLYYNSRERILYANDGGYEVPTICNLEYVHELQHALRLCGIKKDIEL